MSTERRSYADPCGIARALDIVGERWTLLVVRELMLGPRRFGQLRDGLPSVSPNVLAQRLRELEDDGVLRRVLLDPPASVPVYELTDRGRELELVLVELGRWGSATPRLAGREMSVASMLFALRTMYDPSVPGTVTYGLDLDGEPFTVAIDEGRIAITRGRPDRPDARIATTIGTLRMVVFLGTDVRAAEEAGVLTIEGDRRVGARLPKFFRRPVTS